MSVCPNALRLILDMEDDLRNLHRLGNVLTTLGTHGDIVDRDCIYVVGCFLTEMGKRLEAQFDALTPLGRRDSC